MAQKMFARNFAISQQIAKAGGVKASAERLDQSRAFLGMSRGNEMLQSYMEAIVGDLGSVLEWKTARVKPSSAADKSQAHT